MEEEAVENNEMKKLTFSYTAISNKLNPPLIILMSEYKSMTVNNLKRILLKSLDKSELEFNRVSLSRISKDKYYDLLLENNSIEGTKAMNNKFIYAFEISYLKQSFTCSLCNYKYVNELKLHKFCKNFIILCDKCIGPYGLLFCTVCCRERKPTDFIKINKRATVISILNIPLSLHEIVITDYSKQSLKKLGFSSLFTLTFENHSNDDSSQNNNISVHFIDTQDHQCSSSCYHEIESPQNCESTLSTRKKLLSLFDSQNSFLEFLNPDDIKKDHNLNDDKNIVLNKSNLKNDFCDSLQYDDDDNNNLKDKKNIPFENSNLQIDPLTTQNSLNKIDKETENDDKNIIHDKLNFQLISSQLHSSHTSQVEDKNIQQKSELELVSSHCEQKNIDELKFDCFNEKSKILDSIVNKLQKIEETMTNFKIKETRIKFNPFENLKFSGRNDFTHPMRFIENFEFFANQENLNDYEKQYFLGQALTNEANEWLKIHGYKKTYEELRNSFVNFFWNKEDQYRFITFLKNGKYNEKQIKLSKITYFHKYAMEAKFLNNIPSEEILIDLLSEHFDTYIQQKLYSNHPKCIDDVLQILRNLEISDLNYNLNKKLSLNFFSSSLATKSRTGTWKDCLNNKYDIIKKEGQTSYRCLTTKLWPLHTLSYKNSMSDIRNFNVGCDENETHFLTDVPTKIYLIFTDIKEKKKDYEVMGPVTIAKQNGRQLIVTTCHTFKTYRKLIAGQLLYCIQEDLIKPCAIVTCSIFEDTEYRYLISNNNEQIVCLMCKEKIDEIEFCESRCIAVNDLIVCYYEQKFYKKKHILRFLNENFCTIYTVWDKAVEKYDPLNPNYH